MGLGAREPRIFFRAGRERRSLVARVRYGTWQNLPSQGKCFGRVPGGVPLIGTQDPCACLPSRYSRLKAMLVLLLQSTVAPNLEDAHGPPGPGRGSSGG